MAISSLEIAIFSQNQLQLAHVHMQVHFPRQFAVDPHVYQYICVAVCRSVSQCVAAWCSVVQ